MELLPGCSSEQCFHLQSHWSDMKKQCSTLHPWGPDVASGSTGFVPTNKKRFNKKNMRCSGTCSPPTPLRSPQTQLHGTSDSHPYSGLKVRSCRMKTGSLQFPHGCHAMPETRWLPAPHCPHFQGLKCLTTLTLHGSSFLFLSGLEKDST